MSKIDRKFLENHIANGGTVLLPQGVLTRNPDDLPTHAELKKLHEDAPKEFKVNPDGEPSRAIGDPTGHPPDHDPSNDSEDAITESAKASGAGERTSGTPILQNDPDNPPPNAGPIRDSKDMSKDPPAKSS